MEKRKVLRKKRRLNLGIRKSIATFLTIAMLSAASMSAVAFAVGQDDAVDVDAIYVEDVYEAAPVEVVPEVVEEPAADEPATDDYVAADVAPVEAADVIEVDVYEIEIEPATFGNLTGADVQALIDAAAPGDVISFDSGAVITGPFTINQGITLEGNGATIILDSAGQFVGIVGNDITFTGFTVNYTYTGGPRMSILVSSPSNNVTISNNQFFVAPGAAVTAADEDTAAINTQFGAPSNGISGLVIQGNSFAPMGYPNPAASSWRPLMINFGADGTVVDGNTFAGNFDRGFVVNVNNAQITNNIFEESYVVSPSGHGVILWGPSGHGFSGDFTAEIAGNTFRDGQPVRVLTDLPHNIDVADLLRDNTYCRSSIEFPFDILRNELDEYIAVSDIEVNATTGGSVTGAFPNGIMTSTAAGFYVIEIVGEETSVTATADAGFQFVNWTITGAGAADVIAALGGEAALTSATLTFNNPAGSVILTANFEGIPCDDCNEFPCVCPEPEICEVCGEEYPCDCDAGTTPGNGDDGTAGDDDAEGVDGDDDADGAGNNRRPGTGPSTGDVVNMFAQIAALAALAVTLAGAGLLHTRKQN